MGFWLDLVTNFSRGSVQSQKTLMPLLAVAGQGLQLALVIEVILIRLQRNHAKCLVQLRIETRHPTLFLEVWWGLGMDSFLNWE